MNILLTNDDGVHSPGIAELARALAEKHKVWIVAPSGERSASGHSITMNLPLFAKRKTLPGLENVPTWAVSGTPADTVKLGINAIVQEKVDLVISGINLGANLGSDIFYSGTFSAAMEAALLGYKGIAVSLDIKDADSVQYLSSAAKCAGLILQNMDVQRDITQVMNINVPAIPFAEIKGFKCGRQGSVQYDDHYEKRTDPRGREYYWLTGKLTSNTGEDTDAGIMRAGYAAITPLQCDLTDYRQISQIKCNFENLKLHCE
jgi:5'-nucleotidase